ncbi:hypothetical protein NDU88_005969 [Pleurodeles waltl]|uniref:Uncharacterized protein n=1 Tax=Pleurodeles waltl TaxID=8319 RepID=A0AAV7RQK2_PLEWA|nr:hypothetical protein NDU88_005969 [Pleurodeles waltl]
MLYRRLFAPLPPGCTPLAPLHASGSLESSHLSCSITATKAKIYVTKDGSDMHLICHTTKCPQLVYFAFGIHASALDALLGEFEHLCKEMSCLKDRDVRLQIDQSV